MMTKLIANKICPVLPLLHKYTQMASNSNLKNLSIKLCSVVIYDIPANVLYPEWWQFLDMNIRVVV